jgi:hypothetical protein
MLWAESSAGGAPDEAPGLGTGGSAGTEARAAAPLLPGFPLFLLFLQEIISEPRSFAAEMLASGGPAGKRTARKQQIFPCRRLFCTAMVRITHF